MDKKNLNLKNKALYCNSCGTDVETLHQTSTLFIRYTNPNDQNNYSICQKCLKKLSNKLVLEEPEKAVRRNLKRNTNRQEIDNSNKPVTPSHIYQEINKHVVGQEDAKKALSIAITRHLRNAVSNSEYIKPNVLIAGPSGTGKTELVRALGKIVKIPVAVADATSLTVAGFVGEDVESILYKLYEAANCNIAAAEKGIVFIDEIDKLAQNNSGVGTEITTRSVQESLLKMIEGSVVNVPIGGDLKTAKEYVKINTSNILFICAGAFPGIKDIIAKRNKKGIGLNKENNNVENNENLIIEDLNKFGLIEEFLGRFSIVTETKSLTSSELKEILIRSNKSPLQEKVEFFSNYNQTLELNDCFLNYIIDKAPTDRTGVRALFQAVEDIFRDAMFDFPDMGEGSIIASEKELVFRYKDKRKKAIKLVV